MTILDALKEGAQRFARNPVLFLPAFLFYGFAFAVILVSAFTAMFFQVVFNNAPILLAVMVIAGAGVIIFLGLAANLSGWLYLYRKAALGNTCAFSDYTQGMSLLLKPVVSALLIRLFISASYGSFILYLLFVKGPGIKIILSLRGLFKSPAPASQVLSFIHKIHPSDILWLFSLFSLYVFLEAVVSFLFSFWKPALALKNKDRGALSAFEESLDFVFTHAGAVLGLLGAKIGIAVTLSFAGAILGFALEKAAPNAFVKILSQGAVQFLQFTVSFLLSVYFTLVYFIFYHANTLPDTDADLKDDITFGEYGVLA